MGKATEGLLILALALGIGLGGKRTGGTGGDGSGGGGGGGSGGGGPGGAPPTVQQVTDYAIQQQQSAVDILVSNGIDAARVGDNTHVLVTIPPSPSQAVKAALAYNLVYSQGFKDPQTGRAAPISANNAAANSAAFAKALIENGGQAAISTSTGRFLY